MTTAIDDTPENQKPIESAEQLISSFFVAGKTPDKWKVGLEHEKIGFARQPDGSYLPLSYAKAPGQASISELFEKLNAQGFQATKEHLDIIALSNQYGTITLEPGGQFEFSGKPRKDAATAVQDLDKHLQELMNQTDPMGIVFMAGGFRPFGSLADVPIVPKGRYKIMRDYLPKHGSMGLEMMHRTATAQANLDYESEADALKKMKVALSASPFVTALFAASPFKEGKPCGYQSYRAACWLDTDRNRSGLLPFVYTSDSLFSDYVHWALDVPMMFISHQGSYQDAKNRTFRQFMQQGFLGRAATLKDWEIHLSSLFPEARLRPYIEVRSADAATLPLVKALPCFWRGLFYSSQALSAAWDLLKDFSFETLLALRSSVPKLGMKTPCLRTNAGQIGHQLVLIAKQGLDDLQATEELRLLEPLLDVSTSQRSIADQMLETYKSSQGNPNTLIETFRYQIPGS